jgi:hypothetical protein
VPPLRRRGIYGRNEEDFTIESSKIPLLGGVRRSAGVVVRDGIINMK